MSLLRYGFVTELRAWDAHVRVRFDDCDDVRSYWLAVLMHKTCLDKVWWMPDIGEHVACLLDEHAEDGVVVGAFYGRDRPAESDLDLFKVQFSDGGFFEHNRRTGDMKIEVRGELKIKAGKITVEGDTTIKAKKINLDAPTVIAAGSPVSRIGDEDTGGDVMVSGASG